MPRWTPLAWTCPIIFVPADWWYRTLEEPTGSGPGSCDDPAQVMVLLAHEIEILASMYKVVIVDDLAGLAGKVPEVATIGFFASCRRLCDSNRRTIVLAAHSYVFDEKLLCRLRVACNAHLSLRTEKIGAKMVKLVEVKKAHDGEQHSGNTVSFEVAAGVGMRTVPGVKIKL